ncbi:uncharacterized protein LY89DRAFT_731613 [Mollisia scopiformis]|uniref:C2H2-type domain-containing protein n=1 Tax=Mollisia scopiformis TaxID=149040 RepID=A0A194XHF1_MOLSC|nr:uncharacterized protein LY89DRAFT_731613 [Mollisia scopiformis]KUJ19197.1 hypothetical protein LY89DRAFT_731613 [Mollisia scopiformis]
MSDSADYASYQPSAEYRSVDEFIGSVSDIAIDRPEELPIPDQTSTFEPTTFQFDTHNSFPFRDATCSQQVPDDAFDMTTTIPASGDPVEGNITPLRCSITNCFEDVIFPNTAALSKHIEKKHTKPYTCLVPSCKHPQFGDKSGLERHKREVHSSQIFRCPIISCKRHTKGFNRAYNLHDHTKRCHPQASRSRAMLFPKSSRLDYQESQGRTESTDEIASPVSEVGEGRDMGQSQNNVQGIGERLEMLRRLRADLDIDIQALERTVEILRNS